jgi:NAD(P)H-nitrite reductase large subunit
MAKYVIIGNSAAGIAAVEGIRCIDKKGEITIISDENFHTYSRPLISYLLCGKTDLNRMKYRNDAFYAETDCKTASVKRRQYRYGGKNRNHRQRKQICL